MRKIKNTDHKHRCHVCLRRQAFFGHEYSYYCRVCLPSLITSLLDIIAEQRVQLKKTREFALEAPTNLLNTLKLIDSAFIKNKKNN